MVRPASKMFSAISFGCFLPLGALNQRNHAVEKSLAGVWKKYGLLFDPTKPAYRPLRLNGRRLPRELPARILR